ncbi:portal protein, partial [Salmonella enterica subsp. enterica serovar Stanley]|nr:portal protein [Salmonella enterica subsp. enterica serovar Stanley]
AITSEEARATAKETAAVTLLTEKAPATGTIDDQNDDNAGQNNGNVKQNRANNASEDTSNAEE